MFFRKIHSLTPESIVFTAVPITFYFSNIVISRFVEQLSHFVRLLSPLPPSDCEIINIPVFIPFKSIIVLKHNTNMVLFFFFYVRILRTGIEQIFYAVNVRYPPNAFAPRNYWKTITLIFLNYSPSNNVMILVRSGPLQTYSLLYKS